MKILVSIRNVYGTNTVYPECETAKTFASLCGTKTLTFSSLEKIKKLGYVVEVKQQTIDGFDDSYDEAYEERVRNSYAVRGRSNLY